MNTNKQSNGKYANSTNTVIILREDYSHTIMKTDVWLVYTTKSRKPWVAIPGGLTFNEDGKITITLATD